MRIDEFFGGLRFKKNWKPSIRFYFALLPRGNKVEVERVRVSPNAKGGERVSKKEKKRGGWNIWSINEGGTIKWDNALKSKLRKKGGLKVQNLGLAAIPWGLWNRLMRIGEFFGGLRFKKNWKPSNRFYFALLPRGNKVGGRGGPSKSQC